MQAAYFEGFCPFELHDKVKVKAGYGQLADMEPELWDEIYIVEDILTIHSLAAGYTVFQLVLMDKTGFRLKPRRCELFEIVK